MKSISVSRACCARQVGLFLSDPVARLPSFQRCGATEFSFAVALKTGTSQGYRDAWIIAWSERYVVGVWGGRADAGPMTSLYGGRSAADLAQAILLHLHRVTRADLTAGAFPAPPGRTPVELCTSSGAVAAPSCATRMTEYLAPATAVRPPPLGSDVDPRLSIVSPALRRESGATRKYPPP